MNEKEVPYFLPTIKTYAAVGYCTRLRQALLNYLSFSFYLETFHEIPSNIDQCKQKKQFGNLKSHRNA